MVFFQIRFDGAGGRTKPAQASLSFRGTASLTIEYGYFGLRLLKAWGITLCPLPLRIVRSRRSTY